MIQSLWTDPNLRGYSFEYIAKVMLRRQQKNNFIFMTNQFDSIDEILTKYRLTSDDPYINYLRKEWRRCDLIEFVHEKRAIKKINIYDIKTKLHSVEKNVFEFCKSGFLFFNSSEIYQVGRFVVSIIIFPNWRFSFSVIPFDKVPTKVYTRYRKRSEKSAPQTL
ncbi:MAG: hypothetical protein ACOC32_05290 [Nanoarchaeota archaeon]